MMFGQLLDNHRIVKQLAKTLTSLRVCAGWSEPLLVAHTTLLEISCRGSNIIDCCKAHLPVQCASNIEFIHEK